MKRAMAVLLLMAFGLPCLEAGERASRWRAVWHVSEALLAGANAADIAGSWGKCEANPMLLAGRHFGYASMSVKLGLLAGSVAAQHYLVRKSPRLAPYIAAGNMTAAGVLSGVAARNFGVRR